MELNEKCICSLRHGHALTRNHVEDCWCMLWLIVLDARAEEGVDSRLVWLVAHGHHVLDSCPGVAHAASICLHLRQHHASGTVYVVSCAVSLRRCIEVSCLRLAVDTTKATDEPN